MRHHQYNKNFKFVIDPLQFDKNTEKELLQYCLGATLYMPGTKEISPKILNGEMNEITSIVMCFEDAIREEDLTNAELNVFSHLDIIADAIDSKTIEHKDNPLTFLRVRNPEQFKSFAKRLTKKQASVLSGFVFPKFYSNNANEYLQLLEQLNKELDTVLYGMPILEGKAIAFQETRINELLSLKEILKPYHKYILNIRVGGTDFSALFGVRRGINYSIYDILTVRDCLSDILNFFNRTEDDFLVSAPVWEYFLAHKMDDLNKLIKDDIHRSLMIRNPILNEAIDGLLREVILDKANGFVGKTIIHPSHARFVNAMQAVTKEEYDDAMQILENKGGVIKSAKSNKMNEMNPHRSWAKKIALRASAYGVVENEKSFLELVAG
ncbi:MAG: HpcH/HpaI aldolase/citrate lyase family protein [Bacteroidales bacterium]|jgi:citrate lyase beta subunit|nr:HpcH/HpaI aldolase/citrate lyase family protein [Bacteroidales bacterium]